MDGLLESGTSAAVQFTGLSILSATRATRQQGMHKATILLFLPWVMVAETHTVAAEKYYRTFSHQHPVLKRILPGDTVITKTVDSGGKDEKGVERSAGGN